MNPLPWPFAKASIWGDGTIRYTRANIREWLLNYPQVFESSEAESSLKWMETKADLDTAISSLAPYLRDFFRLYCLEQRELPDIMRTRKWRAQTCDTYWCRLVSGVCQIMCDQEMYEMAEEELSRLPAFRSDIWTVNWYDRN